ncbi:MAG: hypothetical protein JW755_14265 [Candidatus Aminicenantes bacterium]|nr:hypothetical protein [Candidatus Aminicenantes bacterium]
MGIKSFSISDEVYEKYSAGCKRLGLNMSGQIENFMKFQLEEEFLVREEYAEKIRDMRKKRFGFVTGVSREYEE